jgi:hypothetical protein
MFHNRCKITKKNAEKAIFSKKVAEKFGGLKKSPYLCTRLQGTTVP